MTLLNAIPRVVLAPLFVIWLGIELASKVALAFILVAVVIFFTVYQRHPAGRPQAGRAHRHARRRPLGPGAPRLSALGRGLGAGQPQGRGRLRLHRRLRRRVRRREPRARLSPLVRAEHLQLRADVRADLPDHGGGAGDLRRSPAGSKNICCAGNSEARDDRDLPRSLLQRDAAADGQRAVRARLPPQPRRRRCAIEGAPCTGADDNTAAFSLDVADGRIAAVGFRASCCATLIAYCEYIAEIAPGFRLEIARELTAANLVDSVPGVPALKRDRAVLAIAAFRAALMAADMNCNGENQTNESRLHLRHPAP